MWDRINESTNSSAQAIRNTDGNWTIVNTTISRFICDTADTSVNCTSDDYWNTIEDPTDFILINSSTTGSFLSSQWTDLDGNTISPIETADNNSTYDNSDLECLVGNSASNSYSYTYDLCQFEPNTNANRSNNYGCN